MAERQATTSLATWRFWDQHVQNDMKGGEFVNAASALIAAGPPRLSDSSKTSEAEEADTAFPIGVVENFGLNQNKMIQKMFEIGSKRAYHIPGRTVGTITLGRILYWGPSLLRVLYAYYKVGLMEGVANVHPLGNVSPGGITARIREAPGHGAGPASAVAAESGENKDFFINLASDLFDHPLGLLVVLKDSQANSYGAFYLEDTYLQAHSFNINASSILVAEGVSAQYDRLVPVNIAALPLPDQI